jgi:hypothetical protein
VLYEGLSQEMASTSSHNIFDFAAMYVIMYITSMNYFTKMQSSCLNEKPNDGNHGEEKLLLTVRWQILENC